MILRRWRVRFNPEIFRFVLVALVSCAVTTSAAPPSSSDVSVAWGVHIRLRDGVMLNGTLYRPKAKRDPAPCIFTLTPYVSDRYHTTGSYFAAHGLPFMIVDVRGRGNSAGTFTPNLQEANDGHDVVEWLGRQGYCNGKVAMWGGSYAGYDQWATAGTHPAHLATIVPAAAAYPGVDFPWRNNVGNQYVLQWLTLVSGVTPQINLFDDSAFWAGLWRDRFEAGEPFTSLEHGLGGEQPTLRQWIAHPSDDAYWDAYTPKAADYESLAIPILTITGSYDDDQPGALAYYRNAMRYGSDAERKRLYLIIGPWDHAGTRVPRANVGGVRFGPASLLDLPALHVDWYKWTMADGAKPAFLRKPVAYYVMGAEQWRYADSLDAITASVRPFYLDGHGDANHLASPGRLDPSRPGKGPPDGYSYDPRDTSTVDIETEIDPSDPADDRMVAARDGKQLVYETSPFHQAVEVSGFFKLSAWIAIDSPDTDFRASIYEVGPDGRGTLLTTDILRARYRTSLRQAVLIDTDKALQYVFDKFYFTSRRIAQGNHLRLVIDPINSIHTQKNYNAGKPVSEQTMRDAQTVRVRLMHGFGQSSVLYVPFGAPS